MRPWSRPVALAVVAVVAVATAAVREVSVADPPDPVGGDRLTTPVLSVRRVPSVVAAPIADRRLRHDLADWAATAPADSCAVVHDVDGEVVLDHRGDVPLVPASTIKLLTATAVLEQLGPDHRFRTVVRGAPPVDGTVNGDLTLVGGGDPILASPDYAARFERQPQIFTNLDTLAASIVDAGVRRVTGSLRGDESRYDAARYVAGWPDRYLSQHVVGPLTGLSVNDAFSEYPTPGRPHALVPAEDPPVQAAAVLTRLLEARGVDVVGEPGAGPAPEGSAEIAAIESEPVSRVLTQLIQESDNSTAELLLKELGRDGLTPTTSGGAARATALLGQAGLDLAGVTMADGSGLSLDDRVTCEVLVDALLRPETGPLLQSALPVAGESGTLAKAFSGTPLRGALAAKTGTLNTVAGLAGTVTDDDGEMTFAYLVNAAPSERVDTAAVVASQARLGEIMLSWPRVPDVEALGPQDPVAGPDR